MMTPLALDSPPLIDVGTVDLIRKGEVGIVHANIDSFTEDGVVLDNGKKLQFDACILCTGFLETVRAVVTSRYVCPAQCSVSSTCIRNPGWLRAVSG